MAGKYKILDLWSVKGSASKTVTLLKNLIPQNIKQDHAVVFLGENHGSDVDAEVTKAIVANPPKYSANANENRVMFERGLREKTEHQTTAPRYQGSPTSDVFGAEKLEKSEGGQRAARSLNMAQWILTAFEDEGIKYYYVACGSEHAQEVFDGLDSKNSKLAKPFDFDFVCKMDDGYYQKKKA